jgi:hypothetical protein
VRANTKGKETGKRERERKGVHGERGTHRARHRVRRSNGPSPSIRDRGRRGRMGRVRRRGNGGRHLGHGVKTAAHGGRIYSNRARLLKEGEGVLGTTDGVSLPDLCVQRTLVGRGMDRGGGGGG